jgi:hypothetical protein
VTESGVQIDRCASAWFISRFVDAEAEFVFFPAGSPLPKGVTYAFYGAHYFRVGAGCTYTALLKAHASDRDPALREIDAIANDTVAWRQGPDSLALAMREGVDKIREAIGNDALTYEQIFAVFDVVYFKAGGTSVAMQSRLKTAVDGVEAQLLSQWLSRAPEINRSQIVDSWRRFLADSGMSPESWGSRVAEPGLQISDLELLLNWAERDAVQFPPEVRSQISICRKVVSKKP